MLNIATSLAKQSLDVTVIVAVKNEAANISRCLTALTPAKHIFVVDSGSTDSTEAIAVRLGAEVVQFTLRGGYPKKRQWALDTLPIATEWVLLLDADEVMPVSLWQEVAAATTNGSADAYLITKGFHFLGRRFRFGGFSHSAVLFFRHGRARFEHLISNDPSGLDMEVHERIIVDGSISRLLTPLIHDDFKGLEAYIDRHNKYSTWEAHVRFQRLTEGSYGLQTIEPKLFGNSQERRRALKVLALRMPFEPFVWFIYHYCFKLGFLEGKRGFIAAHIRASYIAQVRAKIFELELGNRISSVPTEPK